MPVFSSRRSRPAARFCRYASTRHPLPAVASAKGGADEQDRTADLVLTKDALCQLSYIGPKNWSGRRGSNPRPTAWKAVTLPLSYSRQFRSSQQLRSSQLVTWRVGNLTNSPVALVGGEGRTRTFEASRATDLQSAAFDRFATSPAVCVLETWCVRRQLRAGQAVLGAGGGI